MEYRWRREEKNLSINLILSSEAYRYGVATCAASQHYEPKASLAVVSSGCSHLMHLPIMPSVLLVQLFAQPCCELNWETDPAEKQSE